MIKLGATEITLPGIDSGYVGTNLVYSSYAYDTITGVSPLFLTNSINKSLRSLTQYGKCVQSGTPTPNASADIACNNGVIKYGWHDIITTSQLSGYGTYVSPVSSAGTRAYKWLKNIPNGTYQFTIEGDYELIVQWRDPADTSVIIPSAYENLTGWMTSGEVVLDKPTGGYGIAVRRTSGTDSITPSNFDGVLHAQELGIYTDGTPEVLTVSGQNLVDLTAVMNGYYYDQNGVYTEISVARLTDFIPVKAGQKYTAYVKAEQSGTAANVRCNLFDTAKTWKSQSSFVVNAGAESVSTITPTEDGYLRVSANYSGAGAKVDWSTLQIVVGEYTISTMPPYQPYTAQTVTDIPMLLSVGDYADEVELIEGIKTGKVGIKVFDGTETFAKRSDYAISFANLERAYGPNVAGLSTHLVCSASNSATAPVGSLFFNMSNNYLHFFTEYGGDVTAFKAWLAAQYAAGSPVIILFPLSTATTEQTTPYELHSYAGNTTVNWTTAVSGTTKTVKYAYKEPPSNLVGTAIVGTAKCT